ncbi:MAG: efflux RND transporter permease subunit [Peptostreptococcales bacterium]
MNITKISIRRPVTTMMVMLIVIIFGVASISGIPLELTPEMKIPYIMVGVSYVGAGPEEIESIVTGPLEESLRSISDLEEISSTSSSNLSSIVLKFVEDTDTSLSMIDVREKAEAAIRAMPEGVGEPFYMKMDLSQMPQTVMMISGNYTETELARLLNDEIVPLFERTRGVASVQVMGQMEKEVQITIDPLRLENFGGTITDITTALRMENSAFPIGQVDRGNGVVALRASGKFTNLKEIEDLLIRTSSGNTVHIKDVASVEFGIKEATDYIFKDGKPAVQLVIYKQSIANTVQTSEAIQKTLSAITEKNDTITPLVFYDAGESITIAIDSVASSAILGGLIAALIVFLFLGVLKDTSIIVLSMPVSIIFTFVLMKLTGTTLNMISLGGLTLGVGMLVDNSIVVLENIYRRFSLGENPKDAAQNGTAEVTSAIVASTLTTIAVFAPMLLVATGMVGAMVKDLALTIILSLSASLFIAVTVVPMLASMILGKSETKIPLLMSISNLWNKYFEKLKIRYNRVLKKSLNNRKKTLIIAVIILIISFSLIPTMGFEMIPNPDMGMYTMTLEFPNNYNMDKMNAVVAELENKINQIPEVQSIMTVNQESGTSMLYMDIGSPQDRKRGIVEVAEETRGLVEDLPEAKASISTSMMNISGSSSGVDFKIFGDDIETLREISNDLVGQIGQIDGFEEVKSSFTEGAPQAILTIDREKTLSYGLNAQAVTGILYTAINGDRSNTFTDSGNDYKIAVSYDKDSINSIEDVLNTSIPSPTGMIKFYEVADVHIESGVESIGRLNTERYATVSMVTPHLDTGTANVRLLNILNDYEFPTGYRYEMGGAMDEIVDSFTSLVLAMIVGALVVYMVMAAQFESLLEPFIIIMTVPLAASGAILGLFVTGSTINAVSLMGMVILIGIVVNNAIVLVDYINQLKADGKGRMEAIIEAGSTRIRPIFMTTLTTVLALIPLGAGKGDGIEMIAPLAISVGYGLSFSTLLTLIIIPVVYYIVDSKREKSRNKRYKKKQNKMIEKMNN